jgi:hypothetical protein
MGLSTDEVDFFLIDLILPIQQGKTIFTRKLSLELRKKLVKCYIWSTALYGAETRTLRKVDQKYLESFEMWCCRRMEKISWTDRVNNGAVLHRVKEEHSSHNKTKEGQLDWAHIA